MGEFLKQCNIYDIKPIIGIDSRCWRFSDSFYLLKTMMGLS
nr:hypothetical protein [Mycoplasmopsis bovis]